MFIKVLCLGAVLNCFSVASHNDGGKAIRAPLNDGNSIPALGIGTFLGFDKSGQIDPKPREVTSVIESAIDNGYRLIDTAAVYRTESQIGDAIKNKLASGAVTRENLYVVTKLPSTHHARRKVTPALRSSLNDLGLDYADMYLIHSPMAFTVDNKVDNTDYLETWKGMEDVQKLGLAKSIGLSNFNRSQIQRIMDNSEIKPSVLQIEVNLNLRQGPLVDFCKSNGIVVMAYSPFGSLFGARPGQNPPPPRHDDPKLVQLAARYNKTTPQIVLRYLLQRGVVPIPKSVNQVRMEQNIDVFDFELAQDEMRILDAFNKDFRVVLPSYFQDHPYYPYERVDSPEDSPF